MAENTSKAEARAVTDKKAQKRIKICRGPQQKGYVVIGRPDASHPNLMFKIHPVANKPATGEWVVRHKSLGLAENDILSKEEARKVREIMVSRQALKFGVKTGKFVVIKRRARSKVEDLYQVFPTGSQVPNGFDKVDLRALGYSSLSDGSQDHLTRKEADVLRLTLINKILYRQGRELLPVPMD